MTISTAYPRVTELRTTLERHILDIFEADGSTLKPYTSWPGYYTLSDASRVPAVYVIGAAMVPSNWVITGVECTIEDSFYQPTRCCFLDSRITSPAAITSER